MKFIIGSKLKMSQVFNEKGNAVPVTLINAGPCKVLQIKNKETDGYEAAQIGFEKIEKKSKINKTMVGKEFKYIKEFRGETQTLKAGDDINVSIFQEGDMIKVSGICKGKGFQGGVKRHGFSGKNATHGVKHEHRTIGSTGCRFPQRVIKGRKMPGRAGGRRISIKNLKIIKVDKDNNLLAIKGAVPGRKGTLLEIRG